MNKLRWKLQNFMSGRNGMDELARMCLIVSCVVCCVGAVTQVSIFTTLSWALLFYVIYRMFSRNLRDRQEENYRYTHWVKMTKFKFQQRKEYKIFKCKSCGRNIRVPRKKGKIEVTCPLCGNKTIHRT